MSEETIIAQARPIELHPAEAAIVRDIFTEAVQFRDDVIVWIDPIDQAFKVKVRTPGRISVWSGPLGRPIT